VSTVPKLFAVFGMAKVPPMLVNIWLFWGMTQHFERQFSNPKSICGFPRHLSYRACSSDSFNRGVNQENQKIRRIKRKKSQCCISRIPFQPNSFNIALRYFAVMQ
jgi:hypothetical protein